MERPKRRELRAPRGSASMSMLGSQSRPRIEQSRFMVEDGKPETGDVSIRRDHGIDGAM